MIRLSMNAVPSYNDADRSKQDVVAGIDIATQETFGLYPSRNVKGHLIQDAQRLKPQLV